MPEGDTLYKLARFLAPRATGATIASAWGRRYGPIGRMNGARIDAVYAYGKHLFLDLSGGMTLRVHLGLKGACRVYGVGDRRLSKASGIALSLDLGSTTIVFLRTTSVELVPTRHVRLSRAVCELGPDLLGPALDIAECVARARQRTAATVAELLLDQRAAAGIGNVFKSEVLFVARLDPFRDPRSMTDEELARVYEQARDTMRANVGRGPRTTVTAPVRLTNGPRYYVYGRARRACLVCGAVIEARRHGVDARITYFCRRCQFVPPVRGDGVTIS